MKKLLFLICTMMIFGVFSLSVSADDSFLLLPSEQTFDIDDCEYNGNAMRLLNERAGDRFVLEFDVNIPEILSKSYEMKINRSAFDSNNSESTALIHRSSIATAATGWKWVIGTGDAAKNVAVNMAYGTDYRLQICVDLENQKQYFELFEVSTGTSMGRIESEPLNESIPANLTDITSHHIYWSNAWVDTTNETWSNVVPTNIKLKRNSSYVLEQPEISLTETSVSASVEMYHNINTACDSPIVILGMYDANGVLLDCAAEKISFEQKNGFKPVKQSCTVSCDCVPCSGMVARVMVVSDLENLIPWVDLSEVINF